MTFAVDTLSIYKRYANPKVFISILTVSGYQLLYNECEKYSCTLRFAPIDVSKQAAFERMKKLWAVYTRVTLYIEYTTML